MKEKLKSGRTLTEKEEEFYNDFKHIYAYVPKQREEALVEGMAKQLKDEVLMFSISISNDIIATYITEYV